MVKIRRVLACIVALAAAGSPVLAYTVLFQDGTANQFAAQGYSGAEDTCLYYKWSQYPVAYDDVTSNYGSSPFLSVGIYETAANLNVAFSLLRFDVSSLAGKTITSARLHLYVQASDYEGQHDWVPEAARMFSADADWVAGHSAGSPETGASCWSQKRYGEQNWVNPPTDNYNPGAWWSGYDMYFSHTGSEWSPSEGSYTYYREVSADIAPSRVTSWISTPSNAGLRLYFGGGGNSNEVFNIASCDFSTVAIRPLLEVQVVPEPSSLAATLMGMCGLAAIIPRRRRRGRP